MDAKIHAAAGVMLRTLERRTVRPKRHGDNVKYAGAIRRHWPKDTIVDPRMRGAATHGRHTKPGLALAVEAMDDLMALDGLSADRASAVVARKMVNWWTMFAQRSDDLERLNFATLAEQLQRTHRRTRRRS